MADLTCISPQMLAATGRTHLLHLGYQNSKRLELPQWYGSLTRAHVECDNDASSDSMHRAHTNERFLHVLYMHVCVAPPIVVGT